MTSNNKKHVAVIEPSLMLREGLKNLLKEIEEVQTILSEPNLDFIAHKNEGLSIDFLIINPSFLYNNNRNAIQASHPLFKRSKFIGLVSNYVNQSILSQFDEVICIDDTQESVVRKIKKLIPLLEEDSSIDIEQHIDLSDREKEILVSLIKGKTNKEIAKKHCISIHTVISHRKNISRKTGIRSVSGLTVYALLNKMINYSDIE